MVTTSVNKEAVWKSFSSHFEELEQLQAQLREIDESRASIEEQIGNKKRVIERATGLSWDDIQLTGDTQQSERRVSKKKSTSGTHQSKLKETSIRQRVLQAVGYFEDHNPQSRIDENSIRIYLNAEAPGFLKRRSPNAIYCALNALKSQGLVMTTPGRGANQHRSQYCLTVQGREALE